MWNERRRKKYGRKVPWSQDPCGFLDEMERTDGNQRGVLYLIGGGQSAQIWESWRIQVCKRFARYTFISTSSHLIFAWRAISSTCVHRTLPRLVRSSDLVIGEMSCKLESSTAEGQLQSKMCRSDARMGRVSPGPRWFGHRPGPRNRRTTCIFEFPLSMS